MYQPPTKFLVCENVLGKKLDSDSKCHENTQTTSKAEKSCCVIACTKGFRKKLALFKDFKKLKKRKWISAICRNTKNRIMITFVLGISARYGLLKHFSYSFPCFL